ncbi:MAG TPA: rod shape-determining protein MreC [Candidatus Dormibacteraeota bacterium]|nr:rod shape-determining protein MreC [Candidatus Dormibacteraeota bacterium]
MESVLGRYRNLIILVGVLFLQVLGLAVQVKRSGDASSTRLIRVWAVDLITPFERGLVWAQNGTSNIWHDYFFLRGVRAENRQLKEKIEQMRLEQVRLNEDATQAHRLQSLLAFKEQFIAKTVPAQVIGSSGSDLSRSIYIDKGENAGLKPDMAVITAGGIVGKVWIVYPSTSLVLMINDQSSGVGALLEKSRLQGVLRGTPDGELILERVMSDEQVAPGETVLSSGGDQIFPKGLPVGTVSRVSPGREMFLSIRVKPAADLNRIEEVLVVAEKQEREPAVAESGTRARAADILAQRLPSVPDKPAVAGTVPLKSAASGVSAPGLGASSKPQANAAGKPGTGTGEVLKKVVQKTAPADSANRGGTDSAASGSTTNSIPSSANPSSANPPAKPATAQPKPANPPANPQPATTDDSPH